MAGNTEFITNSYLGEGGRPRLFLRGVKRLALALGRPAWRLSRGKTPQLRYCIASSAGALGLICGTLGLKKLHPGEADHNLTPSGFGG